MIGDEWCDGEPAPLLDDGEADRRYPQSRRFAYCTASAVVGTAAAMGLSSAASGVAQIALWYPFWQDWRMTPVR
jgi:hypothetical protein